MPRIQAVQRESATAPVAATLDAVKAKVGKLPNLIATFANSPAVLNAYLAYSETLGSGRLSPSQRELIALAVGQANACQYCLSAHTLIGKATGLSEAEIQAARAGRSDDGLNDALTTLAVRIVSQRGVLSDVDLAAARARGLDDGLIVEVIGNVALNILTNYVNHAALTVVDFPVVEV